MHISLLRHLRISRVAACLIASVLAPAFIEAQVTGGLTAAFMFPQSANAGDPRINLTVTGGGFITGSVVYWGSQPLSTTFASANQISAVVPPELLSSAGQIPVIVLNPDGRRSNALTFTINAAPVSITTVNLPPAVAGTAYAQTLAAAGGVAPYVWSAEGLPPGLTLNQAGQIAGTPAGRGNYTITVRVVDANQRSATQVLTLSVSAPAVGIATNSTLPSATEGIQYTQTFTVVSGTSPLRWSVGPGLPPGLTLDGTTGILAGVPTARGSYSFNVQVSDVTGANATKEFALTVAPAALAITTVSPLFRGTTGSPYSQTFAGSGGTPPYTWSMRQQVPGLLLDRTTGVLAGTPEQATSYVIAVQLSDAAGAVVSKEFTLAVDEPQLRITNTSALPGGAVGTLYQQRFLATGGRLPYTWAIASGSIAGVLLDSATGILSGTPSAPGTFSLSVSVRDGAGITVSRTFTVAIAPGALRLSPIQETLRSTAGEPFTLSLSASGGAPPYAWEVNGLPEGLEIDVTGQIIGAARVPGSYLFTVRVTDSARAIATELYKLDIMAPAVPALTVSGLPAVSKAAEQATFRLELAEAYSLPLSGQLLLAFAPETGSGDPSVQFSSGGRSLDFRIPAGTREVEMPAANVGVQTGTVAGTITLSLRMQTPGANLTPTPLTVQSIRVERSAPVITSVSFVRTSSGIEIRTTGYSTTREMTQAVFRFSAASGNSLTNSELTLPLDEAFGRWFRDTESAPYGGQFTFAQQFAIQGDPSAVNPVSVTLTNRSGTTTFEIR